MAERERGRVRTWPEAAGRRPAFPWPDRLSDLVHAAGAHLKAWTAAEAGPGRLMPWLPVAFGFGIVLYFTAEREPLAWAPATAALAACVLAFLARRRALAFPVALMAAAVAAGFAAATLRGAVRVHPILQHAAFNVSISGFVEVREERERSDRIVVRVHAIEGLRSGEKLERVRVAVRKKTAPPVAAFVSFKARLNPPLSPLRPGGYDFARDLYFQRIGAIGFALGAIKIEPPPVPPDLWLRYASVIDAIREAIDRRIRASIPGDAGAIASALITGKRDAISAPVNDAMYVSSLAHVLSISGYHMAVVAGVVFFVLRAGLALVPGLAVRRPIKKWSAAAALLMAAFYLLLSGAEVATQRAFIMTAIVLTGVMVDRPALTLRTLAVAALAVMLVSPEAVVHPSFQMSFAATLALIAAYERGVGWISGGADTSLGARVALWGVREVAALVLASLVAGLATTPYAAYHFHRLAPYGVLANLLAMPIVSAWVMPAGLLALSALPFGFDGMLWRLMAGGIDWMVAVALWVASLPGAVGRIPAFGVAPLLMATLALVVIALLRTPLRWSGAGLIVVAVALAATPPRPDVLVAASGEAVAVRTGDGRLSMVKTGNDAFAFREWLAADGDARPAADPALGQGFSCDPVGCIARLGDGSVVALARAAEAFADDCARAALIVTAREAPPGCGAKVIGRGDWQAGGALALRRTAKGWEIAATRPPGLDRPWAPTRRTEPPASIPAIGRPAARDATPRPEDLEAGD